MTVNEVVLRGVTGEFKWTKQCDGRKNKERRGSEGQESA